MSKECLVIWYAVAVFVCGMSCLPAAPVVGYAADPAFVPSPSYPVVETGQQACYDNTRAFPCPSAGAPFSGQDAQYAGISPIYIDNHDGTILDRVTGLMWVKARGEKQSWDEAMRGAAACRAGGYSDWRAPTIKQLYSLIDFRGRVTASGSNSVPYLDTRYFDFAYGNTATGERPIDCQDWSATEYTGTTMGGQATIFGVNFADGRIKGYPKGRPGNPRDVRYIRYVRGNPAYGLNHFRANGDGTVTDAATTLVWQQQDSGTSLNWQGALAYCEDLSLAGHEDWRLPDAKELQSIVDYTRSPEATGSAAIDPLFGITNVESYFWTGTTHLDGPQAGGNAVYVAFGRAMGNFAPPRASARQWMDVHGAGAQRSDPKTGNPADYAQGFGPQGDDRRINNYVRCVRGGPVRASVATGSDTAPWAGKSVLHGDFTQSPGNQASQESPHALRSSGAGGPEMKGQGGQRTMGMQGGPKAPPREAVTACTGNNEGSECVFTTPRGSLKGLCRQIQDALACVPDHGMGGPGGPGGGMQ